MGESIIGLNKTSCEDQQRTDTSIVGIYRAEAGRSGMFLVHEQVSDVFLNYSLFNLQLLKNGRNFYALSASDTLQTFFKSLSIAGDFGIITGRTFIWWYSSDRY